MSGKKSEKITKKKTNECNLKSCLNQENGKCDIIIPTVLKVIEPDSCKCPYYETEEMKKRYINSFKKTDNNEEEKKPKKPRRGKRNK